MVMFGLLNFLMSYKFERSLVTWMILANQDQYLKRECVSLYCESVAWVRFTQMSSVHLLKLRPYHKQVFDPSPGDWPSLIRVAFILEQLVVSPQLLRS